ncbi:MAG: crossover junction endodeoxyribonuclease RuvC [bacterium]
MPKTKSKTILGIDPGYGRLGFGIIKIQTGNLSAIDYGCITTSAKSEHAKRLMKISKDLKRVLKRHKPDLVAIEQIFFAKNVKTAIKVSEARGAILLAVQESGYPIIEFTPLQVKIALTGYGRAEKFQVQKLVEKLLNIKQKITTDDAADALAIAICAAHNNNLNQ